MEPILVDTSVWIDYFKGQRSAESDIFHQYLSNDEPLLTCPTIIQEVLQGIRNDADYTKIKESVLSLDVLTIEPVETAIGSADLYRSLRKSGTTIKRTNDCLIAFYAIYFKVALLHRDKDFNRIAKHSSLRIKRYA